MVEGLHDIQFLRRISKILHADDHRLPDLAFREQSGELIFLPTCGGNPAAWTNRLAPLDLPEFHILDREAPPETEARQHAVELVNQRPGCLACLTSKRRLENYLHPLAIREARVIEVAFGDDDDVAALAACHCYALRQPPGLPWLDLPPRCRKRLRDRAKHWLNTYAVDHMTPDLLAERDLRSEVRGWLATISSLSRDRYGRNLGPADRTL